MRITVLLSDEATTSLLSARDPKSAQEPAAAIVKALAQLGHLLSQVHPGVDDPALRTQFFVEVPDSTAAEAVISSLRPIPHVRGAYVKPAEELP